MTMTPAEFDAANWEGWTAAVGLLHNVDALGDAGLDALIEELKYGRWAEDAARPLPPGVSARRRLLLDGLCRARAAALGLPEWPWPGDLIGGDVPDDLAGLA